MSASEHSTEKTLLLDALEEIGKTHAGIKDVAVQNAVMQGSINQLLSNHARAEEDRRHILTQVERINGRIRALETFRDQAIGAGGAVKAIWLVAAGLVGFVASWAAKKLGL